jgi:Ca-activated chloride channel homolog
VSVSSPLWLLGLLLVPAVLVAYLASRARAKRYAARFTAVPSLRIAAGTVPAWWRHLPAALMLAALAMLVLALARPHATTHVAVEQASVMLVTDHSGSMQASDVQPTRLLAAERAADAFIDKLPARVRVGAVAFSTAPDAVQGPSSDHNAARRIIDDQTAAGATATGDALELALELLRPGAKPPPAAIVLLSDGAANAGRDPIGVASQAAHDKIPIYTVALGNADATIPNPDPFGPPLPVPPDPQLMQRIAQASGGRAFTAQDAGQLSSIYQRLGSQLGSRRQQREITAVFAVGGLILLLAGVAASLRWSGRLP